MDPSVLVLVGNAPGGRDEELRHNPRFVRFLAAELLPWLRRRYGIRVPPSRCAVVGSSLGGLTAAYAALRYPHLFGNVLAQSGAFIERDAGGVDGSPTLMQEYARRRRGRTRFYLNAGTLESTVYPGTPTSLLAGVRHFRDVLTAKGYRVAYGEFSGGHDYACWGVGLGEGLLNLLPRRAPRRTAA
ncbi:enterochelin esterase [mine drainage metagenome]|uniref:Enterochelin esterase n=1 Tax=mine drainage metagenome TaxID=410659 RepID=T1ADX0_9ZZZZ